MSIFKTKNKRRKRAEKNTFLKFFFFFVSEIKSLKFCLKFFYFHLLIHFSSFWIVFQWTQELDEALRSSLVSFLATTRCVIVIFQDSHVVYLPLLRIQLFILLTTYRRPICLLKFRIFFLQKEDDKGKKGLVDPYMEFSFCGKKVTNL